MNISARPAGGTGMLAVFCDLAPEWHWEFREWLRDDMIPARLKIGFAHCASYDLIRGTTSRGAPEPFVTVYETASIGALYDQAYQGLRKDRDPRDKAFHARFIRPARYTLSWVGPELSMAAGGFAPVAVFDRLDIPERDLQTFNAWYVDEYLPALGAMPGIARVRRYLTMEGNPRHVIMHELASPDVLSTSSWLQARAGLAKVSTDAAITSGAYVRALAAGQS